MRVSDLITNFIYEQAHVKDIFTVTGGGAMFLNDSLACHTEINTICCHHEQAATMAAVAYAKYNGFGCSYVTTGCGGTNAITSVLHAWQDNTPCIFISGQVKRAETSRNSEVMLRQFGVQEADIVKLVEPITKYAVMINDENDILYHLEKALFLAKNGRPGPVWIDVPLDIQSKIVKFENLKRYVPDAIVHKNNNEGIQYLVNSLEEAKRPIIIAGQGIRLSDSIDAFEKFVEKHDIPFVCSRLGFDLIPTEHELNIGRIGTKGMRSANFAVQNADLVIVLGSRLSVSTTGHEYQYFAREAKIIVVDIDENEHKKNTIKIDCLINTDLKQFFNDVSNVPKTSFSEWKEQCKYWKAKYPVFLEEYNDTTNGINMYLFTEKLSQYLPSDAAVVTDAGSAVYVPAQGLKYTQKTQRYITSGAQAEMGFTVPGTIGVCAAKNFKDTIGITGDGSFQMNIQELQTIAHHNYPIKLFVWNNDGYLSIRTTQNKYFDGRLIGTDKNSGVSFPELEKISLAYDIKYYKTSTLEELDKYIPSILEYQGPVICEVMCDKEQLVMPIVSARTLEDGRLVSSPLEDMFPFLPREEFKNNMIVKPVEP